jgi:hypothetical protein
MMEIPTVIQEQFGITNIIKQKNRCNLCGIWKFRTFFKR